MHRCVFDTACGGHQAIGIIAHDTVDTRVHEQAHVRPVIYCPAYDLQILRSRGGEQRRTYQIAANGQLARADFQSLIDRLFNLAIVEQAGHHRRFNPSDIGQNCRVEGNNDGPGNFAGCAQTTYEGVFTAEGATGFHFQVEDHVVFFGKIEDLLDGGNALTGKFAAEPGTGVEAAQLREGEVVHGTFSVGGPIYGFIVNGYQAGIASQLQIGFDEGSAQGYGFLESGQSIFRRVAGGPAMGD